MENMLQVILENLKNISVGLGIFVFAYLANMSFSLYYNIKIAGEIFDSTKMKNGLLKMLSFLIGTLTLVIAVSIIPIYADKVGFTLPEDFVSAFSTVAIISVPLYGSCRYAILAFTKMKEVLNSSVNSSNSKDVIEDLAKDTIDSFVESTEKDMSNSGDTEINYNVGPVEQDNESGKEEPDETNEEIAESERIIDHNIIEGDIDDPSIEENKEEDKKENNN